MRHLRADYDSIQPGDDLQWRFDDPEEPVFLLRGRDPSSAAAVRVWADDVEALGGDPALVARVREWASEMGTYAHRYGQAHDKAVADVPEGALR